MKDKVPDIPSVPNVERSKANKKPAATALPNKSSKREPGLKVAAKAGL